MQSVGTSLNSVIQVTASGGKPQVHSMSCAAHVEVGDLDFHGGLTADLLDLFKGLITKHIDSSMNSLLCKELTTIVDGKFNQVLNESNSIFLSCLPSELFHVCAQPF